MRRLSLLVAVCACAASLAGASTAAGDVFGPIKLESSRLAPSESFGAGEPGTVYEQAEKAGESVISANGRYIAFVGSFAANRGIWRRDLETGSVEQVAPGEAKLPSISASGRYVSFTTTAPLDPEDDHNKAPDVYVRDMDKPCASGGEACLACDEDEGEACPFVLVSAVDGSRDGATYAYTGKESEEERRYGSLASGRTAMDAEGTEVVFETAAESNLLGGPTPAREILLRNLNTDETTLVSSEYDPQTGTDTGIPVPFPAPSGREFGAAYPVSSFQGVEFGGASISANGSTVAWLGQDIGLQAKLLPGEQGSYEPQIDEPLWRRIEEGPSAPTRRVTGFTEPENPACVASGESTLGTPSTENPCQGPFKFAGLPEFLLLAANEGVNFVPQLSESGEKVAFLASAPEIGGEEFPGAETRDDLYVSQMGGGLTRIQALRRVTEITGEADTVQFGGKITDLAISPDGNQVAFTSPRTIFSEALLTYVSPVEAKAGIGELYDADLADDTVTRVTHGYTGEAAPSESGIKVENGEVAGAGASSPSFDESGEALAFSSTADNLAYGDGNGASDAFLATRLVFADNAPAQFVSSPPPAPALVPAWRLYVSPRTETDGALVLHVETPGTGELSAGARAKAPVKLAASRKSNGKARGRRAVEPRTTLQTRTVAAADTDVAPGAPALQQLTLSLKPAYRRLAERAVGLYTAVTVRFSAPGHPTLSTTIYVTLHRTIAKVPAKRAADSARGPEEHRR